MTPPESCHTKAPVRFTFAAQDLFMARFEGGNHRDILYCNYR